MNISLTFYYHNILTPAIQLLTNAIVQSACHQMIDQYNEFSIDVYALLDNPNAKTVVMDWDNTLTADIEFYSNLINSYIQWGWNPIICTLRNPTNNNLEEIRQTLGRDDIRIYGTDGVSKQSYLQARGIEVHLWLDDYFPAICKCGCPLLLKNGIEL